MWSCKRNDPERAPQHWICHPNLSSLTDLCGVPGIYNGMVEMENRKMETKQVKKDKKKNIKIDSEDEEDYEFIGIGVVK